MDLTSAQWEMLRKLRDRFLQKETQRDYWESLELCRLYDETVAKRIQWKWNYVLNELVALDWKPTAKSIVDFGCGTGMASTSFLSCYPNQKTLELRDRSPIALDYTRSKLKKFFPNVEHVSPTEQPYTLLVSHVYSELPELDRKNMEKLILDAESVIFVEPGDREHGRLLSEIRNWLSKTHSIVAPCPFSGGSCGLLEPGMESHWCHFFAPSPDEIFHDRFWSRYAKELGVDLTSLPVSYLVATKEQAQTQSWKRVLGLPRVLKAEAKVLACGPEGVREERVQKRDYPEEYKLAKKGKFPSRFTFSD